MRKLSAKYYVTAISTIIVALILLVLIFWLALSNFDNWDTTKVKINNVTISAKTPKTAKQLLQGLGGTSKLAINHGMLFVFPSDGNWGFWMKGMKYNLDIVWINNSKKIVTIDHNLSPSSYPKTYYPNGSSRYVLEVNGGTASNDGWKVGMPVTL